MSGHAQVLEYKCPCCNSGLIFGEDVQRLKCEYCDNTFDLETVRAYNESELSQQDAFLWENPQPREWTTEEQESLISFQCPSCGGEIIADDTTAASFCPYCDNPAVMPSRLTGTFKPDSVIPFKTSKEDAKSAFLRLCRGKPLLPKFFTQEQRLERITGIYVPFWLYDCQSEYSGSYKATRIHRWSDSRYDYTKTEHFLLRREAEAAFSAIPMDGSEKMDDTLMESIEPYDYAQLIDFDLAYLSGYLADKYDVPSENGEARIRDRVENTIQNQLQSSLIGYASVVPTSQQTNISHGKAHYVLLPVWILNTNYRGKCYTFAMNGQTGKMTGSFPVCPKRTALWFSVIFSGVTILATLAQMLF